jgi:hypothetical protein
MDVALIINTCKAYYKTTIPIIIESCKINRINPRCIYVVVGDCSFDKEMTFTGDYNIVFCRYVNIDYNAIMYFTQTITGLSELRKYTHFFYTHDTTLLLHDFWKNVHSSKEQCNMYIKLLPNYSKNIGLINVEWFLHTKIGLFSEICNTIESDKIKFKCGGFPNLSIIRAKYKNLPPNVSEDLFFLFDEKHNPLGGHYENETLNVFVHKKYSNEERLTTVYYNPGIIKYQKNYEGHNTNDMTL